MSSKAEELENFKEYLQINGVRQTLKDVLFELYIAEPKHANPMQFIRNALGLSIEKTEEFELLAKQLKLLEEQRSILLAQNTAIEHMLSILKHDNPNCDVKPQPKKNISNNGTTDHELHAIDDAPIVEVLPTVSEETDWGVKVELDDDECAFDEALFNTEKNEPLCMAVDENKIISQMAPYAPEPNEEVADEQCESPAISGATAAVCVTATLSIDSETASTPNSQTLLPQYTFNGPEFIMENVTFEHYSEMPEEAAAIDCATFPDKSDSASLPIIEAQTLAETITVTVTNENDSEMPEDAAPFDCDTFTAESNAVSLPIIEAQTLAETITETVTNEIDSEMPEEAAPIDCDSFAIEVDSESPEEAAAIDYTLSDTVSAETDAASLPFSQHSTQSVSSQISVEMMDVVMSQCDGNSFVGELHCGVSKQQVDSNELEKLYGHMPPFDGDAKIILDEACGESTGEIDQPDSAIPFVDEVPSDCISIKSRDMPTLDDIHIINFSKPIPVSREPINAQFDASQIFSLKLTPSGSEILTLEVPVTNDNSIIDLDATLPSSQFSSDIGEENDYLLPSSQSNIEDNNSSISVGSESLVGTSADYISDGELDSSSVSSVITVIQSENIVHVTATSETNGGKRLLPDDFETEFLLSKSSKPAIHSTPFSSA